MRNFSLLLIACILPFCGFSEFETVEGVVWRYYISNDHAIVGGYETTGVAKDTSGDIRIPVELGGKPVTSIHSSAFSGCSLLTNVEIHEGVSSIGQYAFSGCNALSQITIPSTIVNIFSGTFQYCSGLRKVEIKNPEATICTTDGIYDSQLLRPAFGGCNSIVEATVPNTSMIRYIFPDSYNIITNITLTEGTTEIRSETFLDCYALECVVMPKTVGKILDKAFFNCKALKSFIIPDSVTLLGSSAFSNCSSLTNVVMSKNLGRIESAAFLYCSSLSSVIIPNSVTNIGYGAFQSCTSLSSVEIPDSITSITESIFSGCTSLENVEIPDSVRDIGAYAFLGCSSLSSVVIPNSVTNIGRYAFYDCTGLKCVEFKNSNTRIPYWITTYSDGRKIYDYPFDGCNSIVDVTIPQHACTMTLAKTFPDSYQSITNIVVLDGVTRIGAECFKDCYELKRIVIPASVLAIYDNAFQNCSALEEIVFLGDAPDVGSDILLGTPRSLKITVKEGSVGWNGGVSTELPEAWPVGDATARGISYYDDSADVAAMTPVITPADGSIFADTCEVSISCAMEGAKIYYRTDGKTPKFTDAYLYKGAFTISDTSKIVAVAVKEGVENGFATATLTKRVLTLAEAAGDADLTFTTGGAADWVPIGDLTAADGVSARSGAVGDEEESWMELSVSGSGTLTFNWKVSCEDDPVSATWDHLAVFVDGKEREDLCFDGETGWENASIVLDSDGVHTVRWVYVKDESDSEGVDCAWISSVNWAPTLSGDITVDIGDDKNVVVPVSWIDKYDSIVTAAGGDKAAALQRTAANGRKVWECFMLGLDPTKEDDDFKITRFWMENGKPMFEFSRSVDGAGNSFVPRIKAKGKANLTDSWSDVPDGGDPSFRFFTAEVVLP